MIVIIERSLEAFENIDHPRKARRFQRLAGMQRTMTAAADEQHRALQITADQPLHLAGEFRIDLPVRGLLPGDMLGTDRMPDVHMFDLGTAIDQQGARLPLQECMGGNGVEVIHRHIRKLAEANIMKARREKRKLGCHHRTEIPMKLPAWITTAATALIAAALPACDAVNLPEIKPGLTTQAEVRARMGEPGFIHWNDDGTATWEYSRQPSGTHCYMISFGQDHVVTKLEQVLNDASYAKVREGMSKDEVRRLLGAPGSKVTFANLGEEIWEWRIEGMPPLDETYFMVHFDTSNGAVKKTSKRIQQKS